MDIGVGSFVVANALVSRQARNFQPSYVFPESSSLLVDVKAVLKEKADVSEGYITVFKLITNIFGVGIIRDHDD